MTRRVTAHRRGAVRSGGDAAGRGRRRRLRRDRRRREDEARRDPHVHDLRVVARRRRHLVGQHVPGCRGRRRLAPLLVLVQVARLDPHPRQAGRAAEVPRGDGRRVRAAAAPAPRRRGRVGDVGRRPPRLDGASRRRHRPTSATCSSAASASSTSRATPTGRASTTSTGPKFHTVAVGAPARPHRQGRRGGGHRARRPRRSCPRIQPDVGHLYVFQREPGWVMPKGERDFTAEERATFANPWRRRQERLRLKWLLEKNIWGGKIFRVDTKQNAVRTPVLPRLHRPRLRRPPRPARRGHADVPVPGQAADLRDRRSIRRSRSPTSSWCPSAVASVTRDGHRRRRRRRARRSTSS